MVVVLQVGESSTALGAILTQAGAVGFGRTQR